MHNHVHDVSWWQVMLGIERWINVLSIYLSIYTELFLRYKKIASQAKYSDAKVAFN